LKPLGLALSSSGTQSVSDMNAPTVDSVARCRRHGELVDKMFFEPKLFTANERAELEQIRRELDQLETQDAAPLSILQAAVNARQTLARRIHQQLVQFWEEHSK
jgi:hypothetical protein